MPLVLTEPFEKLISPQEFIVVVMKAYFPMGYSAENEKSNILSIVKSSGELLKIDYGIGWKSFGWEVPSIVMPFGIAGGGSGRWSTSRSKYYVQSLQIDALIDAILFVHVGWKYWFISQKYAYFFFLSLNY